MPLKTWKLICVDCRGAHNVRPKVSCLLRRGHKLGSVQPSRFFQSICSFRLTMPLYGSAAHAGSETSMDSPKDL